MNTISQDERIIQVVAEAIAEVNEQLPQDKKIDPSRETVLFDRAGSLDSLGLVTLVVALEQRIEETFDVALPLAGQDTMTDEARPFRTVGSLIDYIEKKLKEKTNA